jgi:hypothetical protein
MVIEKSCYCNLLPKDFKTPFQKTKKKPFAVTCCRQISKLLFTNKNYSSKELNSLCFLDWLPGVVCYSELLWTRWPLFTLSVDL